MNSDIEVIIRFLLALVWGAIVGAEREYRGKPAGFRTTIMISFGACFFTLMSIAIGGHENGDRIAANIITGIGFLGAGVIFRNDHRISGITTAATIWAVAAVGMGIGAGYYTASGCASVLILFVLAVLPTFQEKIDRLNKHRTIMVRAAASKNTKFHVEEQLKVYGLKYVLEKQVREGHDVHLWWEISGRAAKVDEFTEMLMHADFVDRAEC